MPRISVKESPEIGGEIPRPTLICPYHSISAQKSQARTASACETSLPFSAALKPPLSPLFRRSRTEGENRPDFPEKVRFCVIIPYLFRDIFCCFIPVLSCFIVAISWLWEAGILNVNVNYSYMCRSSESFVSGG